MTFSVMCGNGVRTGTASTPRMLLPILKGHRQAPQKYFVAGVSIAMAGYADQHTGGGISPMEDLPL